MYLKTHVYSKVDTTQLTADQVLIVRQMYMQAIRNFLFDNTLVGIVFD